MSESVDRGFKDSIFRADSFPSKKKARKPEGYGWRLPQGVDAFSTEACELSYSSKIIKSESDYYKTLSSFVVDKSTNGSSSLLKKSKKKMTAKEKENWKKLQTTKNIMATDVGKSKSDFTRGAFTGSRDFKSVSNGMKVRKEVYITSTAKCEVYSAKLKQYSVPPIATDFNSAVTTLPVYYNLNQKDTVAKYFDFVKNFGTHVVQAVIMGSKLTIRSEFTSDSFRTLTKKVTNVASVASKASGDSSGSTKSKKKTRKVCGDDVSGSNSFNANNKNSYKTNSNTSNTDTSDYEELRKSKTTFCKGARPPSNGNAETWAGESKLNPVPIFYELVPIYEYYYYSGSRKVFLISDSRKRESLKKAHDDYRYSLVIREELGPDGNVKDPVFSKCDGKVFRKKKCFKFFNEKRSWYSARHMCKKWKGDLAFVMSKHENNFVIRSISSEQAWIGLNDLEEEGTYLWGDKVEMDWSNFMKGQPDNSAGGDCVIMNDGPNLEWNDIRCENKKFFVCSRYFKKKKSWHDARRECKKWSKKGGDLVKITDKNTMDWLQTVITVRSTWLGLSDIIKDDDWRWVGNDQEPINFENWARGEPASGSNRADCAYKILGEKWSTADCSHKIPFICESKTKKAYHEVAQMFNNKHCTKGNKLRAGYYLKNNECLKSSNGKYTLVLMKDGNLLIVKKGAKKPTWQAKSWGKSIKKLALDNKANLALITKDNVVKWQTDTKDAMGESSTQHYITLTNRGALVLYKHIVFKNTKIPIWSSSSAQSVQKPPKPIKFEQSTFKKYLDSLGGTRPKTIGDSFKWGSYPLYPNQLLRSKHGYYYLLLTTKGDLQLFKHSGRSSVWSTKTNRKIIKSFRFYGDGNVGLETRHGFSLWKSRIKRSNPYPKKNVLRVTDNGNVVIEQNNIILWRATEDQIHSTVKCTKTFQKQLWIKNDVLKRGECLESENGRYVLKLKKNGYLRLSQVDGSSMYSLSSSLQGYKLKVNEYENLVLLSSNNGVVWQSNTKNKWSYIYKESKKKYRTRLELKDDGSLSLWGYLQPVGSKVVIWTYKRGTTRKKNGHVYRCENAYNQVCTSNSDWIPVGSCIYGNWGLSSIAQVKPNGLAVFEKSGGKEIWWQKIFSDIDDFQILKRYSSKALVRIALSKSGNFKSMKYVRKNGKTVYSYESRSGTSSDTPCLRLVSGGELQFTQTNPSSRSGVVWSSKHWFGSGYDIRDRSKCNSYGSTFDIGSSWTAFQKGRCLRNGDYTLLYNNYGRFTLYDKYWVKKWQPLGVSFNWVKFRRDGWYVKAKGYPPYNTNWEESHYSSNYPYRAQLKLYSNGKLCLYNSYYGHDITCWT